VAGYKKWETADVPFGKGANSVFYLQYRRADKDDTSAIDSIGCYSTKDKSLNVRALDALSGMEFVHGYSSLITSLIPNAPYYYLTVHKVPVRM
jgi:hypothetical protein